MRDYKNTIDYARDKGMEEGIEKNKIETARKMLEMGVDVFVIQKATSLSMEILQKLSANF